MLILKIEDTENILSALKIGQVLVLPTETSYGLSCDATNQEAVDKIFKIKGRESGKPLLVVTDKVVTAKKYLEWNDSLENLAKKYWQQGDGPLTIVGQHKTAGDGSIKLAMGVVSPEKTLAMRVTHNEFLKNICARLGRPMVSTSANLAGEKEIYDSMEAERIFGGRTFQPDAIVAAGRLPKNPPSTVVLVLGNEIKILRQGELRI